MTLGRMLAARLFRLDLVPLPLVPYGTNGTASRGGGYLPLDYSYRASADGRVSYKFIEDGQNLEYRLHTLAAAGGSLVRDWLCFSTGASSVDRGAMLEVDLCNSVARLDGRLLPVKQQMSHGSRKFIADLRLTKNGKVLRRFCSHYLPFDNKAIGRDYYFGDDYVDYQQQTEVPDALTLIQKHCPGGRLLDVGCALGIYTKAFLDAGFDAHGVDISDFAIAEAARRVGVDRVRQANLDEEEIPFAGAFDVFWMWDVLEHSASPRALLEKITRRAAPKSTLLLHTSNADSLMRRAMGREWEGYSDYSHHGVDQITATVLAQWLDELGWKIKVWECNHIWVGGVDPILMRLRDAFRRIPELGVFLAERNLGDVVTVVAIKSCNEQARKN